MELKYLLVALVFSHFLCDYALQNDFIAKFKARLVDGKYNPMWIWILTAHASIHALPVLILTKSLSLTSLMFITHWFIDLCKCEGRISFNQDQWLHLMVVFSIAVIGALL